MGTATETKTFTVRTYWRSDVNPDITTITKEEFQAINLEFAYDEYKVK